MLLKWIERQNRLKAVWGLAWTQGTRLCLYASSRSKQGAWPADMICGRFITEANIGDVALGKFAD